MFFMGHSVFTKASNVKGTMGHILKLKKLGCTRYSRQWV